MLPSIVLLALANTAVVLELASCPANTTIITGKGYAGDHNKISTVTVSRCESATKEKATRRLRQNVLGPLPPPDQCQHRFLTNQPSIHPSIHRLLLQLERLLQQLRRNCQVQCLVVPSCWRAFASAVYALDRSGSPAQLERHNLRKLWPDSTVTVTATVASAQAQTNSAAYWACTPAAWVSAEHHIHTNRRSGCRAWGVGPNAKAEEAGGRERSRATPPPSSATFSCETEDAAGDRHHHVRSSATPMTGSRQQHPPSSPGRGVCIS